MKSTNSCGCGCFILVIIILAIIGNMRRNYNIIHSTPLPEKVSTIKIDKKLLDSFYKNNHIIK